MAQEHDGTIYLVTNASRKLLGRERIYFTIEKEGLVIVFEIKKIRKISIWEGVCPSDGPSNVGSYAEGETQKLENNALGTVSPTI